MTIQQAAQAALDVQDACNLSGVVFSFAEAMDAICEESNRLGKGTCWKNVHPIVTLFLAKLASLNNSDCFCAHTLDAYTRANEEVSRLALGITVQP